MSKITLAFYVSVLAVLGIAACKGPSGPAGPAGQSSLIGSISGLVTLYQYEGNQDSDASGVNVSVQGTSLSTTTDFTGRWTINGLSTGTYTVVYTKAGYGMSEQQGVQFVGGGPDFLGAIILRQPPDFSVRINPSQSTADSAGFNVEVSSSDQEVEDLLAVGRDSSVSASMPGKYVYANIYQAGGLHRISSFALHEAGFAPGTTAYIVAYPLNNDDDHNSSYFDIATEETVYTSLGQPSVVIALTVP